MVAEIGNYETGEVKRWCMFCQSPLTEDPNPPPPTGRLQPIGAFFIHETTGNHGCVSPTNPAVTTVPPVA